jgi:hypothetical protein
VCARVAVLSTAATIHTAAIVALLADCKNGRAGSSEEQAYLKSLPLCTALDDVASKAVVLAPVIIHSFAVCKRTFCVHQQRASCLSWPYADEHEAHVHEQSRNKQL